VTLSFSVNDCSAGYSLKNSIISFQPKITCTEACCDSNQDEFLICQFSGPLKYSIKGKLLTIDAEAGPIEFTLSAKYFFFYLNKAVFFLLYPNNKSTFVTNIKFNQQRI
jgi:hypothetical protein